MLAGLRVTAQACGYALTVHGSQRGHLDLVAVPWVPAAIPPSELVQGLAVAHQLLVIRAPRERPHGRLEWLLVPRCCPGPIHPIDLAVMPRGNALDEMRSRIAHNAPPWRREDPDFPGCRW